jgi:uncharacterized protein YndB with AHSA1/START domain
MIELSIETHIERPVAEVFAYCTDPARLATWQTNTVSAVQEGAGQMEIGTRLREVHRAPGGKALESLVEVSEYELDRLFALRVIEGTPVHAQMSFEPNEGGTLMRFAARGRLSGAMRLVEPPLQRILKRQFASDCATLKRVLENAPASSEASSSTTDRKVAKAFGLEGESWMRHANPASVWTRFTGVSVLSLAIWSRDWIGVWCLIPVALALVWLFVNPRLFKAPKSTHSWASRAVLGERIWVDRDKVELPEQFRSRAASLAANTYSTIGMGLLAYGLVDLDILATVTGILITHGGKVWYMDRVALMFADMKDRSPEYASWDY